MKFASLFTIACLTYAIQIQAAPLSGNQDNSLAEQRLANVSPYADTSSQSHVMEPINMKRAPGEEAGEFDDLEDGDEGQAYGGKKGGKLTPEQLEDLQTK
ncbi:unnamed protein product [Cunninghamella blakesleeana]